MNKIWIGPSGFVPNVGEVETGKELTDEQVRRMRPETIEKLTKDEAEPAPTVPDGDRN